MSMFGLALIVLALVLVGYSGVQMGANPRSASQKNTDLSNQAILVMASAALSAMCGVFALQTGASPLYFYTPASVPNTR